MSFEEDLRQLQYEKHVLLELTQEQRETIRLQQEQLRLQEEQLVLQQQLIAPVQQQVEALSAQGQLVQERLAKDSHNSHLPPSSDRFKRQPKSLRQPSGKKPGGQSGHLGSTLHLSETPDQIIRHPVEICSSCQHPLHSVESLQVERRQVIDVPPKRVVVIEHQAERKCCLVCQQVTMAPFPQDVPAPVQYGPAFAALAVYLVEQQLLPYERACEVLFDVFGHTMTEGTLHSMVLRCAEQLEAVE